MIVPWLQSLLRQLVSQLGVVKGTAERSEYKMRRTFDDRLAFAVERKGRVVYLIGPELLGGCDYNQIFAVPDKHSTLAGCNEDEAVLGIIDVEVSSDIEDEVEAVLAVIDIELLFLDGVDLLDSEALSLVDEAIIVGVYFFLYGFGLEDVGVEFWFLFDCLLHLLEFDWLFLLLYHGVVFNSVQRAGLFLFFVELTVGEILQRVVIANVYFVIFILLRPIITHPQVLGENIAIVILLLIFGTLLANVWAFFNLKGFFVHIVGEFFFFAAFGTRTDIPHFCVI